MVLTTVVRCCSKANENLHSFFYLRPPLVIFIINLAIFAVSLFFLSYWIQYNDMQNPDATKDWNRFLERFTSMEVCLTGNKSYPFIRRLTAFTIDGDSAIDLPPQPLGHANLKLAVHRMTLDVELDNHQRHLLSNYSVLIGAISGKILGLRDRSSAYQVINITAVIPQPPRSHDSVCIEMVGPESIFPRTRAPPTCHSSKFEASRKLLSSGATSGWGMSYMYIFKTVYWSSMFFCSSSLPKLRLKYTHNPRLTEMLSTEEKYVAEENLSHTAYALAVLIACFLAYAAAFGAGRLGHPSAAVGGVGADAHNLFRSFSHGSTGGSGGGGGACESPGSARPRNCYSMSSERSLLLMDEKLELQQQHKEKLELESGRKLSTAD